MPKKIVRVPITGFIQIIVDAPNAKEAESIAFALVNACLSSRDVATGLNVPSSTEDFFLLVTDSTKQSVCIDEDYIEF